MTTSLDTELEQLLDTAAAVSCRRCGTGWPAHGDAGGPVTVTVGGFSSPAAAVRLTCPGFQWVDPAGPSTTYGARP